MNFNEQVAIVTGGAQGIGWSIVQALRQRVARVVIADIAVRAVKEDEETGIPVTAIKTDVSSKEQVNRMVDEVQSRFGRVDVLVNNAGICEMGLIEQLTEEKWDRMMAVNLKGVLFFCQAVMPVMKKQRYGKIVNISSIAGKIGGLLVGAHYSVSKAGVICLTKCLARELASYGITVNAIAPALTDTPMSNTFSPENIKKTIKTIPLGRMATAQDIAETVLFLVSQGAGFITGQTFNVNGGSTMD